MRACFPNHVWMMDLTEVPAFLRLFSYKLAVVLDVFWRMPLAARVSLSEPSGKDVARLVLAAARRFGPPRHSVSDQGAQFTSDPFRRALDRLAVRHRYGAVGRTGSIALIDRFFRTLKAVADRLSRPPLLRVARAQAHARLQLLRLAAPAPPAEVWLGSRPAHLDAIPPPRGRPGEGPEFLPSFETRYLDPERRLPYLARKAA